MHSSTRNSLLICGLLALPGLAAQAVDPKVLQEVVAVKVAMDTNKAALRQYTWNEHTEVLIKGDVKKSTDFLCRYDGWGELQRKPVGEVKPGETPQAMSKRPMNRKKADTADYVERAISLVRTYLPPNPERLKYLLENGRAALGQAAPGQSEIRFTHYFAERDTLTFTYDPKTKALLKVGIHSYLGTEKDPVTLDALFESLPDGTYHLASAVLNGSAKKLQVTVKNSAYQKVAAQ